MKYVLSVFYLPLLLLFTNTANALDDELRIYAELLTKENPIYIKVAAQTIYKKKINNTELTDIAAEVLARSLENKNQLDFDTQSWLIKSIAINENKRYQPFLNSILKMKVNNKLKKHVKKSLRNLWYSSEKIYQKGDINLTTVVNNLALAKKETPSVNSLNNFNQLMFGNSINDVINKSGLPDQVEVVFSSRRHSMLKFKYHNIGNINFNFVSKPESNWIIKQTYQDKVFTGELTSHPMMNKNQSILRSYIKERIKQIDATQLDRDLAAERLFTDLSNADFIDALSWSCKFLALNNTARYRSVLEYTVKNSPYNKLRKYAKVALKQTKSDNEEQYKKGDVFKSQTIKETGISAEIKVQTAETK